MTTISCEMSKMFCCKHNIYTVQCVTLDNNMLLTLNTKYRSYFCPHNILNKFLVAKTFLPHIHIND